YGVHYLLSPALSYQEADSMHITYGMKIDEASYFSLAIPGMLCLQAGLFAIRTSMFSVNFEVVRLQSLINQKVLKAWLYLGIVCSMTHFYMPGELAYFVYLLSGIRYVAAFSLFSLDKRKYRWH